MLPPSVSALAVQITAVALVVLWFGGCGYLILTGRPRTAEEHLVDTFR